MKFKDSVMAKRDNSTNDKTNYHKDDNIFYMSIGQILGGLETDHELYKNQTKEQLQKSLKKQFELYKDILEQDFKFYCKHIIPKFIGGLK